MKKEGKNILDKLAESNWTPVGILITIISLWLITGLVIYYHYFTTQPTFAGQFGDMFGMTNSLFSGLAFGGLIYTIILQRKELDLTRQELVATRDEFVKQNETLSQQRFENTFFNLLKLNTDNINNLKHGNLEGRECFVNFYNKLTSEWNKIKISNDHSYILTLQETLECYVTTYKDVESKYGNHFKNLYHIMRLINDADETIDKVKYARLVRAQLSSFELVLLFYNCLTPYGMDKFKPLIEKFKLFKHLEFKLLLNPTDIAPYKLTAFGR